ncbi:MAG: hypothetical protein ABI465_07825 [Ktedonobacteraceae bacterium]
MGRGRWFSASFPTAFSAGEQIEQEKLHHLWSPTTRSIVRSSLYPLSITH